MANERGHAINLENYKILIDRCGALNYQPVSNDIKIAAMTTKWNDAVTKQGDYLQKIADAKVVIVTRADLYDGMIGIARRSKNVYSSITQSERAKVEAESLVKQITGFKKKIKKPVEGEEIEKHISNSHRSFTQMLKNFEILVDMYTTDGNYDANENDLKLTSLTTLLTTMKTACDNVDQAGSDVMTTRVKRNEALYKLKTGIVDNSLAAKDYVKGAYGATSPEAKSVTGVKIVRFMRIK